MPAKHIRVSLLDKEESPLDQKKKKTEQPEPKQTRLHPLKQKKEEAEQPKPEIRRIRIDIRTPREKLQREVMDLLDKGKVHEASELFSNSEFKRKDMSLYVVASAEIAVAALLKEKDPKRIKEVEEALRMLKRSKGSGRG